jgi:hypothetical protein
MKPVAQLVDNPETGDCFRACVASILELDPLTLPNIHDPEFKDRYWLGVLNEKLAPFNLALMYTAKEQCYWEIPYFIWSIRSPTYEGKTHAVVVNYDEKREGSAWKIAWDPSPHRDEPGREPFYAKPLAAYFFIAVNPKRVMRFEQVDAAVRGHHAEPKVA